MHFPLHISFLFLNSMHAEANNCCWCCCCWVAVRTCAKHAPRNSWILFWMKSECTNGKKCNKCRRCTSIAHSHAPNYALQRSSPRLATPCRLPHRSTTLQLQVYWINLTDSIVFGIVQSSVFSRQAIVGHATRLWCAQCACACASPLSVAFHFFFLIFVFILICSISFHMHKARWSWSRKLLS